MTLPLLNDHQQSTAQHGAATQQNLSLAKHHLGQPQPPPPRLSIADACISTQSSTPPTEVNHNLCFDDQSTDSSQSLHTHDRVHGQ